MLRIKQFLDIGRSKRSVCQLQKRYHTDNIHKRAGSYITDWAKELDSSFREFERLNLSTFLPSRTIKRSSDNDENQQQSKRLKQTQSLPDKVMREHYDNGTIGKVSLSDARSQVFGY
jgi:hypothetical protein